MPENLIFSVVISTFNRNDDLSCCLEALQEQTYLDFEVVIVNGGDFTGVKRVTERFSNLKIKVVNQTKRGIVEARNLGWLNSNGDIVCFIDDDLVVTADWVKNISEAFLSDNKIGGVSGPTLIPEDRKDNRDLAAFLAKFQESRNILLRLIGGLYISIVLQNRVSEVGKILKSGAFTPGSNYKSCLQLASLQDVDYLEASHMCFRRDLLKEINGFDYIYEGTGEWNEPDFCFKVKSRGYRLVFNPKAITYHYISQAGVFKARTNSYERSRNFIFFYMRWIKPDSIEKLFRFGVNIFFINMYWLYKFIQTKNTDWLKGINGTFVAFCESRKVWSICGRH